MAVQDRTGEIIGDRFQIAEPIGKGAMADVYRAIDLTSQAPVALKILRHQHVGDPVSLARFQREAEVQSRLRHRNVAALLASGVTDRRQPYLAVELLRGTSLRNVIKTEGRISPRRAASYAWQALSGLSAIHAAGVLHRDLKPANIMLEPSQGPVDRVVLIDFGFATFEGSAKLTVTGTVVGSLTYIAPERLRGEPTDHRADLYAIGIILFELLTGTPPFTADDDFSLIDAHVNQDPPRLRDLDPTFPQALDDVIDRALAKHASERFPDAESMAGALDVAAQSL